MRLNASRMPCIPYYLIRFHVLVAILLSSLPSAGTAATDNALHIDAIAEYFSLHSYQTLQTNKAIAIGPGGAWAHAEGESSAKQAEQKALARCQAQIRGSRFASHRKQKCVLFDSNGKRTGLANPVGIPFGTVPEGPDLPYLKGDFWPAENDQRRGIVLFLHGCGDIKETKGLSRLQAWFSYYRAAGYSVALPDSFAETRDSPSCGPPGENGINRQTRNLKLRVAQTRRTLAGLRKNYPGQKIYVHGHSEGSFVAQALDEEVAGVIITGGACGFFGPPSTVGLAETTRFLAIAGSKDEFNKLAKDASQYQRECRKVFGGPYLETLFLPGAGHTPGIWNPEITKSVSKLLDVEPVIMKRRKAEANAEVPADVKTPYRQWKRHKAVALDSQGSLGAVGELESQFDAEESALVKCNLSAGINPYLAADDTYRCFLVDVNGKKPK